MIRANYTVVLSDLLNDQIVCKKINKALSTYPMYQSQSENEQIKGLIPTREQLNQKILNFYKYREIGFETPARFIDELEISMCEIMPYYNQMFHTVEIMNDIEDPFGNVDFTETYSETRHNEGEGETKSDDHSVSSGTSKTHSESSDHAVSDTSMSDYDKKVHTDAPGNSLDIPTKGIDGVAYADNVEWNHKDGQSHSESDGDSTSDASSETGSTVTGNQTANSKTKSTETVEHTFKKKGNQGVNTYAHDIIEFRDSILNIEQQIINDKRIKELFMMIF